MKRYIERSYQATSLKGTIEDSLQSNSPDNALSVRAVRSALYRPNLLVNGDFHCWQRGEAVNLARNTGGYTADMWYCENKRTDSEMQVYKVHENASNDIVKQYYALYGSGISALGMNSLRVHYRMPIEEAEKYNGKTVTLSYSLNKQITVIQSYVFDITEQDRTNGYVECFYLLMSAEQVLNWVRLDEGNIAYQHIPEDHAIALARCREWLYALVGENLVGYVGSTGNLYIQDLNLTNLKNTPSVTFNNKTMTLFIGDHAASITTENSPNIHMNATYYYKGLFFISGYKDIDMIPKNHTFSGYFSKNYNVHALFSCEP